MTAKAKHAVGWAILVTMCLIVCIMAWPIILVILALSAIGGLLYLAISLVTAEEKNELS